MGIENIKTKAGQYICSEFGKQQGEEAQAQMVKAILFVEREMGERIARQIEEIDLGGTAQFNGFGMRMQAAKIARGQE